MTNSNKYIKVSIFSFFVIVFIAPIYVLFVLNLKPYCVLPQVRPFADCGLTLASWQYEGNSTQKMLSMLPELLILIVLGIILFSKSISRRSIKFLSDFLIVAILATFVLTLLVR